MMLERYDEAESVLRDSLSAVRALGSDHFYVHRNRAWLAEALMELENVEEATALLPDAIEALEEQADRPGAEPVEVQRELDRAEQRMQRLNDIRDGTTSTTSSGEVQEVRR